MLTKISSENIRFFDGLLGPFAAYTGESDILIGGIDEEGDAVSACSLTGNGSSLFINFFAVTPERQRMGVGSGFLQELEEYIASCGFHSLESVYFKDGDEEDEWEEFLKDAGFRISELEVERHWFSFAEARKLLPESDEELPKGCEILRGTDLSVNDAMELFEKAAALEEKGVYMDADSIVSEENRYGGVLLENGEIVAAVSAIPIAGDIRIDTILIDPRRLKNVKHLMRFMLDQAEGEREVPESICMEASTDELSQKLMQLYTRTAPAVERTEKAFRAVMEV